MTRSELMALVDAFLAIQGKSYVSATADKNAVANRRLKRFTERTKLLYTDSATLTLVTNTATYDMRSASFSLSMLDIDTITINGAPLTDFDGWHGLGSIEDLQQHRPTYLSDSAGQPTFGCIIPFSTLRLWPKPDQVYTPVYVAGHYLHPDIDTSSGGNSTALSIPDEYCETAAVYVAVGLTFISAGTESDYERMSVFSKSAADEMAALEDKAARQLSGPAIRGSVRSRPRYTSLG